MKCLSWAALLAVAALGLRAQEPAPAGEPHETNINERYTVESVEITGIDQTRLSRHLRDDVHSLIGQRFSQARLDDLSRVLRRAFPGRSVSVRVSRGTAIDHVKVEIRIDGHEQRFDLAAPRALYNSREGWTGEIDATVRAGSSNFTFGVLSDGDSLLEREAGLRARYENRHVGTDRLRLAFEFSSLHNMWNTATLEGIDNTRLLYRTRQNFEPLATVLLARPLRASFGFAFQRFQSQFPAAHTEASNAVIFTLRYDRQLEGSGGTQQRVEAGYHLRAATRALDSDYSYNRQTFDFRYALWRGHHRLSTHLTAGALDGFAPLFDRFVLGNSSTLRGWSKYDLAPLGGDRAVANSLEYRYRSFVVFYDTGAIWNSGTQAVARHSLGAGLRLGELALLVAFPLRNGRADPVFIAGLNL